MRASVDKKNFDPVRLAHMQTLHPFRLFSVLRGQTEAKAEAGGAERLIVRKKGSAR